jgi:predicted Zn finger-like uncharacterized protein
MKFQCDRCKTRYSIADERVRGKILKIRCKNCSAVITVREGMEEGAAAGGNGSGPMPAIPAAAARPATAARAAGGGGGGGGGGSALQGAFAAVMSRPQVAVPPAPQPISPSDSFRAPVHIAEEWYLSVDGDQQGPFGLDQAKEWVLSRPPGEELYCWQEDFDDWLPIEKVSHFRGLRGRGDTLEGTPSPRARTATPPPLPAAPVGRAAARPETPMSLASLQQRAPVNEDTPKPLFDAAMRKIQERAASEAEPDADEADPFAALAKPAPRAAAPSPAPRPSVPAGKPTLPRPSGSKSNGEPAPIPVSTGMFEKVDNEPQGDGLDFDIGEASRIVKLPMLMAAARDAGGAAAPAADAGDGLPGVAKIAPGEAGKVGRGTASVAALRAPLAPLSDSALAEAQPSILAQSTLPARRSPLLLPLLIGGGVVLVALVVLMVVMLGGGDDDEPGLERSDVGGGELGGRDYVRGGAGGTEGEVEEPLIPGKPIEIKKRPPRPTGDGTGSIQNGTGTNPTGPLVTGPTDPGATPLQPGEVITELHRQALGNRRCYERALKKDPFLDVKSIPVKITIDAGGVVTGVTLGSHGDTVLGQCLMARLRQWSFRKSTKGISMNLTLTFEQQ